MLESLIKDILKGTSPELQELRKNSGILIGFMKLVQKVSSLSSLDSRFYEDKRSLYQATARGIEREDLENIFKEFFGLPAKDTGVSLPLTLRFNASVKYLKGIKKNQVLFLKQLNTGEFYGALWPWKRDKTKTEIHLGYCSAKITGSDYKEIQLLINKTISKKTLDAMNASLGGAIRGVSISSFLQMSHMEATSCMLKVSTSKKQGYLHLRNGDLIGAETGSYRGRQAAYRIISWDNIAIQILNPKANMEDEIQLPLMNVLMESLKIKDEKPRSGWQEESQHVTSIASQIGAEEQSVSVEKKTPEVDKKESTEASKEPLSQDGEKKSSLQGGLRGKRAAYIKKAHSKKGPSLKKWILVPLLCMVFGVSGFYLFRFYNIFRLKQGYDALIEEVTMLEDLNKKDEVISKYLDKNQKGDYWNKAFQLLKKNQEQIERADFASLEKQVRSLKADGAFIEHAKKLYHEFLSKYPNSPFTSKVQEKIASVWSIYDDAAFNQLKEIKKNELTQKFAGYSEYLNTFKEGKYRMEVFNLLNNLSQAYFELLKIEIPYCDKHEKWERCITLCDNFISTFEKSPHILSARKYKRDLSEKRDYQILENALYSLEIDDAETQKLYVDYLKRYPNSLKRKQIYKKVKALNAKIALQKEWQALRAYVINSKYSKKKRILRLKKYMAKDSSGPFLKEAHEIMDSLKKGVTQFKKYSPPKKMAVVSPGNSGKKRTQPSFNPHPAALEKKIQALFRNKRDRFEVRREGIIKDKRSGLEWTLLDSRQLLGGCLNYTSALNYIKGVRMGGKTDWRLPTSEELASIYKSGPTFPDVGTKWYWTSESFSKGHHNIANIVTTRYENKYKRKTANHDACGAVRAVRP